MNSLHAWVKSKINSPYATPVFALLLFIEGFFIMPANTLLILYGIERPKRVFFYATIGLIASILGGLTAYGLGALAWYAGGEQLIYWLVSKESFEKLVDNYTHNQVWIVFTLSFLPIPYKLITISAGFCHLPLVPFILCIGAARALRFYLIASALHVFGTRIQQLLDKYFAYFLALTIAIIILTFWVLH